MNNYSACQPNPKPSRCVGPNSKNLGFPGIVTCVGPVPTNQETGMALDGRCLDILESLREPIAEYQEKQGLSKTE